MRDIWVCACMWRSEGNVVESLSFYYVGFGDWDQIQVAGLAASSFICQAILLTYQRETILKVGRHLKHSVEPTLALFKERSSTHTKLLQPKDCDVPAVACCPSLDSGPTPSPWSVCLCAALASCLVAMPNAEPWNSCLPAP